MEAELKNPEGSFKNIFGEDVDGETHPLPKKIAIEGQRAKKENTKEKLSQIVDSIQGKKDEISVRLENDVYMKKAFPILSGLGRFGRWAAQRFYGEEYLLKVDTKEKQDEKQLANLDKREQDLQAKIESLDSPQADAKQVLKDIEDLLKKMKEEQSKGRTYSTESSPSEELNATLDEGTKVVGKEEDDQDENEQKE